MIYQIEAWTVVIPADGDEETAFEEEEEEEQRARERIWDLLRQGFCVRLVIVKDRSDK